MGRKRVVSLPDRNYNFIQQVHSLSDVEMKSGTYLLCISPFNLSLSLQYPSKYQPKQKVTCDLYKSYIYKTFDTQFFSPLTFFYASSFKNLSPQLPLTILDPKSLCTKIFITLQHFPIKLGVDPSIILWPAMYWDI